MNRGIGICGGVGMTARKAQELRDTLCAAGAAITPWGCLFEPLYPLIAGVMAAFSGSIPHTLSNKCPHCGKQSGIDEGEFSSSAESASTDKYPGSPWLLPACSWVEPAGVASGVKRAGQTKAVCPAVFFEGARPLAALCFSILPSG